MAGTYTKCELMYGLGEKAGKKAPSVLKILGLKCMGDMFEGSN